MKKLNLLQEEQISKQKLQQQGINIEDKPAEESVVIDGQLVNVNTLKNLYSPEYLLERNKRANAFFSTASDVFDMRKTRDSYLMNIAKIPSLLAEGAYEFTGENVAQPLASGFALSRSQVDSLLADNKWQNYRDGVPLEVLHSVRDKLAMMDPNIADDFNLFSMEGTDAIETAKKRAKALGITLSEQELEVIGEYAKKAKAKAREASWTNTTRNLQQFLQGAGKDYAELGAFEKMMYSNNDFQKFQIQLGNTMAQIGTNFALASIPVVGGAAVMGLVFGRQYNEKRMQALEQGWSTEKAHGYAMLYGSIEALTELIELSAFKKGLSMTRTWQNIALTRILPEAFQEGIQTTAEATIDNLTGLDPKSFDEIFCEVAMAMLIGGLAGGGISFFTMGDDGKIELRTQAAEAETEAIKSAAEKQGANVSLSESGEITAEGVDAATQERIEKFNNKLRNIIKDRYRQKIGKEATEKQIDNIMTLARQAYGDLEVRAAFARDFMQTAETALNGQMVNKQDALTHIVSFMDQIGVKDETGKKPSEEGFNITKLDSKSKGLLNSMKKVMLPEEYEGFEEGLNIASQEYKNDLISAGMTEEQAQAYTDFVTGAFMPLFLKSSKTPSEIYKSLMPTVIRLNRATIHKDNRVEHQSILNQITQAEVSGNPSDRYKSDLIDARSAWSAMSRVNSKQTESEEAPSVNDYLYGMTESAPDIRQTKAALMQEAQQQKEIFNEAGLLTDLTSDDWVAVAILMRKGYSPTEIVKGAFGERYQKFNGDIETMYRDALNKLYPPLTDQEVAQTNKMITAVNSPSYGGRQGAFTSQSGAYVPAGVPGGTNSGILIGENAPQNTVVHEMSHSTTYEAITQSYLADEMGIVVSSEMNDLLNSLKAATRSQFGNNYTYRQFQETTAQALTDYFSNSKSMDGNTRASLRKIQEKQDYQTILESQYAEDTDSAYSNLSKKQKTNIQKNIRAVQNNSMQSSIQQATQLEQEAYTAKENDLKGKLDDIINNPNNKALQIDNAFFAERLNKIKGVPDKANLIQWADSLGERTTPKNSQKLLDMANAIRNNDFKTAKDIAAELLKTGEGFTPQDRQNLNKIHKELDQASKPAKGASRVDLAILAQDVAAAIRRTAAAKYAAGYMTAQKGTDIETNQDVLFSNAATYPLALPGTGRLITDPSGSHIYDTNKLPFTSVFEERFDSFKEYMSNFSKFFEMTKFMRTSVYRHAYDFDPVIGRQMRELYQEHGKRVQRLTKIYDKFISKFKKDIEAQKINRYEYNKNFTYNILNGKVKEATDFVRKVSGEEGVKYFKDVYKTFTEMENELNKAGIYIDDVSNYFPRKIVNYEKFMEHIGRKPKHPLYNIVRDMESQGKSRKDIIDTVNAVFYAKQKFENTGVTALSNRSVKFVQYEDVGYYEDPLVTLMSYADDMSRTIMMRKAFGFTVNALEEGKNGYRKLTQEQKESLRNNIKNDYIDSAILKKYDAEIAEPLDKVNSEEALSTFFENHKSINKDQIYKRVAEDNNGDVSYKNVLAYMYGAYPAEVFYPTNKTNEAIVKQAEDRANQYIKKIETEETDNTQIYGKVGARIIQRLEEGASPAEVDAVIAALRSLGSRTMGSNAILETIRQLNTLVNISANIYSGLNNFLELGLVSKRFGWKSTIIGMYRAFNSMKSGEKFLETVGIPELTEPLQEVISNTTRGANQLAFFNKWCLRFTGFAHADEFMKTTAGLAAINKLQTDLKKPEGSKERQRMEKLLDRYFPYNENMDRFSNGFYSRQRVQVEEDLKNGVMSDDVKFVIFNVISDQQPINSLEVPPGYNSWGGVGKLCYQFTTSQLKQMEFIENDIKENFSHIDPKTGKRVKTVEQGVTNLLAWAMYLGTVGLGKEFIESILKGRKPQPILTSAIFAITQYAFLSEYVWHMAQRGEFINAFMSSFLPTFTLANSLIRDTMSAFSMIFGKGGKTITDFRIFRHIPIIGAAYWWLFGGGATYAKGSSNRLDSTGDLNPGLY